MRAILSGGSIAVLFLISSVSAHAHATLEITEAPLNSTYRGVVRVPHGCDGLPTLKVRVRIPEGVIAVKPMPKPGWSLETIKGKYTKTYDYFGTPMAEGVQEIIWTGKLLDEHYDEFVFRARLTDSLRVGQILFIPIVQECQDGKAERWIEIPAADKKPDFYKYPAPGIKLLPAQPTH